MTIQTKSMRWLCNTSQKSMSSHLELVQFGPKCQAPFQYFYQNNFSAFVQALLDQGEYFDGVLFFLPEVNEIPMGIEHVSVPIVSLLSDWNLNFQSTQIALKLFDMTLLDLRGYELLKDTAPVRYFNMYGLHTAHFEKYSETTEQDHGEAQWDVVFIGNLVPSVQKERGRLLRRLLQLREQLKIKIETRLFGQACIQLMHQSKVIFNGSIRGEANMRVFESLACQRPVLLENSNREIIQYLEPEKECVLYDSNTMDEQIIKLVRDDMWRESIIDSANQKRLVWSAQGCWERLNQTLQGISRRTDRQAPNSLLHQHLVPNRWTPLEQIQKNIEASVASTMSLETIDVLLGVLSMYSQISEPLLTLAHKLFEATLTHLAGKFWRIYHFAKIHETAGFDYAQRELELWILALETLQIQDRQVLQGGPLYALPYTRHADLQKALWNGWIPNTFAEGPLLIPYLKHMTLHRIGEILGQMGAHDKALEYFKQASQLYSRHALTWIRMAEALPANTIDRMQALEMAFDLDPLDPHVSMQLAQERYSSGNLEATRALLWELEALQELQFRTYHLSTDQQEMLKAECLKLRDQVF